MNAQWDGMYACFSTVLSTNGILLCALSMGLWRSRDQEIPTFGVYFEAGLSCQAPCLYLECIES